MTIFQKIIDGEVPAHKIYEDDRTLAFLDIFPTMPGHTLVIPKSHQEFVWDLQDEDYQAVMKTCKKVAKRLREALPQAYIHMGVIGIDVPHAHVHLIPFDSTSDLHKPDRDQQEPDHEALSKMAEKLRF